MNEKGIKRMQELVDLYEEALSSVLREYLSEELSREILNKATLEYCRKMSKETTKEGS